MFYPKKHNQILKYLTVCFIILLTINVVYGQKNLIDSLKNVYSDIRRPPFDYFYRLGKAYSSVNRDSSEWHYQQAIEVTDSDSLKAEAYMGLGLLHFYSEPRSFIKANEQYKRAVEFARRFKNGDLLAKCLLNLAGSQSRLNQRALSLRTTLEAKKLLENSNDSAKRYNINTKLGNAYYVSSDYVNAIKQFKIAESFARTTNEKGMININKAATYMNLKLIDSTIICYKLSYSYFSSINRNVDASLNGLSESFFRLKEYDSAINYTQKWIAYISQEKSRRFHHYPYTMLGKIYFEKGDLINSENYYLKAIDYFSEEHERKFINNIRDAYQKLAIINAQKKNFQKAYEYQIQYQIQNDSINKIADRIKLNELLQLHEFEKTENELKIKTEENEKIKYQNQSLIWMYLTFLVAIILVVSLLLKRYQKRLKSKELEKQDILKNKEALQENFNVLNKEINQKKQDLISYSLQLIHNKELFQSVIQDLKNINQLEKSEQDKKISSIISTIKIALSNQKDWENFRNYFDSIHQNFFTQLNKKYPNLTSTDHKIAALTILGLDNKQAASILDVEPETVKVSKNRLKKKLSLVAEDDLKRKLNEFVIELN